MSNLPTPLISSKTKNWEGITVEKFHQSLGETKLIGFKDHTLCIFLSAKPIWVRQQKGDRIAEQFHRQGNIAITPANLPQSERWYEEDYYLHLRLQPSYLHKVALEAGFDANRVDLLSEFKTEDAFLSQIAMSFIAEVENDGLAGKLYVDSLTNLLAVHLLRNYCTTDKQILVPSGGLSKRKLQHSLDYIQANLDSEISLNKIADSAGMSSTYFSRLFKRSLGTSPYQYVIQQRVERAKQLLSQSERSITDIGLECGFANSGHFARHFRSITGMSASEYRRQL